MRILLIEDDAETADYVSKGLRAEGHIVELTTDGIDGLHSATDGTYDLLIVDRMLPRLDGLAVVTALRSAGNKLPVLMLTALGSVSDRVDGLNAGADDYLVKPFSFAELTARLAALSRRPPLREEVTELVVGDLKVDRLKRKVVRGHEVVDLQPREYQLLEYLMLNSDRIVTRAMLLEAIWDFNFDPGTNIVETHISRLRLKIERGESGSLIKTVRGAGYMISAD